MKYSQPDTPEVEDNLCLKVLVPNAKEYIVAFWTAYYYLAKWTAWEVRGDDTAKRAADVWKAAVEQSRQWFEAEEYCGECAMEVRQNPSNPCLLEYNDGSGWTSFANLVLCKNYDDTLPALFPAGMDVDDKMQFAANLIKYFQQLMYYVGPNQSISTVYTGLTLITPVYRTVLGQIGPMSVDLSQALAGATTDDTNPLKSEGSDFYKDLADFIVCDIDDSGDNWLQVLADKIFEYLNSSSDKIFEILNAAVKHVPPSMLYTVGSGGAGFSGSVATVFPSGKDCDYDETFDFTSSQYNWVIDKAIGYDPDADIAEYTPGVGFTPSLVVVEEVYRYMIGCALDMGDNFTLTRIEFTIYAGDGCNFLEWPVLVEDGHFDAGAPPDLIYSWTNLEAYEQTYAANIDNLPVSTVQIHTGSWTDCSIEIRSARIVGYYSSSS